MPLNKINQMVYVIESYCVFIVEGNGFVNIYKNLLFTGLNDQTK
jgi:hypothetical protein